MQSYSDTEENLIDAIVRNPSCLRDEVFYATLSPRVLDRAIARMQASRVPAKIFNAHSEAK